MIEKEIAHRFIDQLFGISETLHEKLIPEEARQHFQQAKKEKLLGLKSLLAHLIEEIEKEESKQSQQGNQGRKIDIEY